MTCHRAHAGRPLIYQLMVRTFGNTCGVRKPNGTLAENGCGRFNDINATALASIKQLGFTHLWLTGVLEHASCTAYPDRPADPPEVVKGTAGSPYAIKDYFDVSQDYALVPARRLDEFKELLDRCRTHGFRTIIDFVPNHVARSYASDVKPAHSFGVRDDRSAFFARDNHFYYLRPADAGGGPPLKLPHAGGHEDANRYALEDECGRVTGNNVVSWAPSANDWYETVKLNYGHDFTTGRDTSHLPGPDAPLAAVPETWRSMDEIIAYWQHFGVDGFRVDMAHLVPIPFWRWLLKRARKRQPDACFFAEAYDNDPAKLTDGNVLDELLDSGFDAVYDDPAYAVLKNIYDSGGWANDLDSVIFSGGRFHRSLRYAENHDEVRLANPAVWGGFGMRVGKPVSAVLLGMGRGPVMIYHGQEVGEPAAGSHGNPRTSIFAYGSMPEFVKWVNHGNFDGGLLTAAQSQLRTWYGKLLSVLQQPAFTTGEFYGLNHANHDNPDFGRLDGESVSGHWLYAFLRHSRLPRQTFLVIANFHGAATMRGVRVRLPHDAQIRTGLANDVRWLFADRLDGAWSGACAVGTLADDGLALPDLAPCSALMLEILC